MKWSYLIAIVSLPLLAGCTGTEPAPADEGEVASAHGALSADQCDYFDVNGKVRICHQTGSATHPYTVLNVSEQACVNAHAAHPGDYVAVNDPTCQGGGCLPAGAPVDATLPCCDGLTAQNGVCAEAGCASGLTQCESGCVDLAWDANNCGACGNYCELGCDNGSCAPPSISRARFKKDITYLEATDTARLSEELMRYRLATWHYKEQAEGSPLHLGFIIDDVVPSAAVEGGNGDHVNLYGYTSMAVAAIQEQNKQIHALQEEVKALKEQLDRQKPRRPAAR